jgi:hypothetical protein
MNFTLFLIAAFGLVLLIIGYRIIFKKVFYFTSFHSQSRKFASSFGDFETKILEAMKKSNFKFIKSDNPKFRAWSIISLWSWGETIEIDYSKTNDNHIKVNCTSTCYFPLQIFDWGKNKRNTNRFFKRLEALGN